MSGVLWIDATAGVAGDMLVGALLDAGGNWDGLVDGLKSLGVSGYELRRSKTRRAGMASTYFEVLLEDGHEDDHHGHGRHLSQIVELIEGSALADGVKRRAIEIFTRLGEAEAEAHGVDIEKVHFHEVGAVDAIIDIVGASILIEQLAPSKIVATPLPAGGGTVRAAHGVLAVPVPAVVRLCRDWPLTQDGRTGELVTPTGAAIVTTVATCGPMPAMRPTMIGAGAGTRNPPEIANITRVILGESDNDLRATPNEVAIIETQLDDCPAEAIPPLIDRLLEAGALDAYTTPATMKKGRPALLLTALAPLELRDRVARTLLRHSTSFGVRFRTANRLLLERHHEVVETPWGPCRVKIGSLDGEILQASPEFEDCAKLAAESGVTLLRVQRAAATAWEGR